MIKDIQSEVFGLDVFLFLANRLTKRFFYFALKPLKSHIFPKTDKKLLPRYPIRTPANDKKLAAVPTNSGGLT